MTAEIPMTPAQKNDHYGMLNERFEERAEFLRNKGFTYIRIEEFGVAVFTRKRYGNKPVTFAAGAVMNADSTVWGDMMNRAEDVY